jgi:hypothetical protein
MCRSSLGRERVLAHDAEIPKRYSPLSRSTVEHDRVRAARDLGRSHRAEQKVLFAPAACPVDRGGTIEAAGR